MLKEKGPCNSCENNKVDGFIESVEEEIRNENWQILWNKYGKFITYATTVLVVGVAIFGFWQRKDLEEKEAISARFSLVQSMLLSGDNAKAIWQLKELSSVSKKDYATLSKLEYASVLRNKNDKDSLNQYKSVFEDKEVNVIFRDLAYIFYVNASLDLMQGTEIKNSLDSFIKELSEKYTKGPWLLMAKESLAFCYITQGKNDLAKAALESIAKTTGVPANMAERARVLMQSIEK